MLSKIRIVHLLILFESLLIGYSLSLVDGLGFLGYFPAGLYFLMSFAESRRLNQILLLYGLFMAFPRLTIIQDQLLKEKKSKIVLEIPHLENCESFNQWSTKQIAECQTRNREAVERAKERNETISQESTSLNLNDWANILLYMVTSALLPLAIYVLLSEERLSISKEEKFKKLISQNTPREEVMKILGIGQTTYYRLLNSIEKGNS